jgi:K+-transporting ATPase ATPase C chain
MLVFLTVLTGLVYPLAVTSIAQAVFPWRADGSLLTRTGEGTESAKNAVGSALIGQEFNGPGYFWSRPSATSPMPYNAQASGGSNLGPSNRALWAAVQRRVTRLRRANPGKKSRPPVDLVTSSASGLDPDISVAAALYQAPRVAQQRHMPVAAVRALVRRYSRGRQLGFLGEPHVNVLRLNLALNREQGKQPNGEKP